MFNGSANALFVQIRPGAYIVFGTYPISQSLDEVIAESSDELWGV
jgi:hypothetical protein